jgi:DNA-binding beta-propeller fold protein YncE
MRIVAAFFVLITASAHALDAADTRRFIFVADANEPVIDVIDIYDEKRVLRIETGHPVDDLVSTPYAPILVFTNIDRRLISIYDLRNEELVREVQVDVVPRHLVLDTTGSRIAITDSVDGGFVLFSPFTADALFALPNLPPTSDVLFDPNEIDIYYTNDASGSLGIIDTNQQSFGEIELADEPGQSLSSPSRSLDGRYVYVANETSGEVYSLNAFSKVIYRTFEIGSSPSRPYTTPEGVFLYMSDARSGRFVAVDQNRFEVHNDVNVGTGIDLVTVGRFDRMNLLASSSSRNYVFYDNLDRRIVGRGRFEHTPIDSLGSADGQTAFVAFRDSPQIAVVDLEELEVSYIAAGITGAGAFSVGLSNNVCH